MTDAERELADAVVEAYRSHELGQSHMCSRLRDLQDTKRRFLAEATCPVKYRRIFYRGYLLRVVDEVLPANTGASPQPIDLMIEACEDGRE